MASKKVSKDGPDLTSLRNKIEEIKNKYPFYNIHPGLLESFARENKIDVDIKNLCDEITTNGTSNPEISNNFTTVGEYLQEETLTDYAYHCFIKAAVIDPLNNHVWKLLGDYYSEDEELIKAFICYNRSSKPQAAIKLTEVMIQFGWPDSARSYLDSRGDAETLDYTDYHFVRGMTYAGEENYEEAIEETDILINAHTDFDIWHKRAIWYAHLANWEKVKESFPYLLPLWDFSHAYERIWRELFDELESIPLQERWIYDFIPKKGIQKLSAKDANMYLLSCLMSYMQKKDVVMSRISTFLSGNNTSIQEIWNVISEFTPEDWKKLKAKTPFHPILSRHMTVHSVARYLKTNGNGDARWVWTDVTRGEVLRRLTEASCPETVTNLIMLSLHTFPFPLSKQCSWPPDKDINRTVKRLILGMGFDNAPLDQQLYCEYYAEVDAIIHQVGKKYCLSKTPHCSICPFRKVCTYALNKPPSKGFLFSFVEEEEDDELPKIGKKIRLTWMNLIVPVTKEFKEAYCQFNGTTSIDAYLESNRDYLELLLEKPIYMPV